VALTACLLVVAIAKEAQDLVLLKYSIWWPLQQACKLCEAELYQARGPFVVLLCFPNCFGRVRLKQPCKRSTCLPLQKKAIAEGA